MLEEEKRKKKILGDFAESGVAKEDSRKYCVARRHKVTPVSDMSCLRAASLALEHSALRSAPVNPSVRAASSGRRPEASGLRVRVTPSPSVRQRRISRRSS